MISPAIVIKGPWLHTILFEVPVLAIVNEVYFRRMQPAPDLAEGRARLAGKLALVAAQSADLGFWFPPTTARVAVFHMTGGA